jgi:hypothetical protein
MCDFCPEFALLAIVSFMSVAIIVDPHSSRFYSVGERTLSL